MSVRILPAVGDPGAARSITTLLAQLPDAEPSAPVADSTQLVDLLGRLAAESVDELPEVVLVHERIGPVPALELIREIALRFPAVGTILITADASPGLFSASMDHGARGLIALPISYEELAQRVQAVASWATGVRRHLGQGNEIVTGVGGTVVAVSGAKGGAGTTLTAIELALASHASGRSAALVDLDLQTGDIGAYLDVQFRRSVVDLVGIQDISPRVLSDALFEHESGIALLLAPDEGERGEEVTDATARQLLSALRQRYEVVIVDCGAQLSSAGAAVIEMADIALLLTTPDVVSVRAAKRTVRMWERIRVRKAAETLSVVNRHNRNTEIQPGLIQKITGTKVAATAVPAAFKELAAVVDAGRLHELEAKSTVKQALWGLAGELGLVKVPESKRKDTKVKDAKLKGDRGSFALRRNAGRSANSAHNTGTTSNTAKGEG